MKRLGVLVILLALFSMSCASTEPKTTRTDKLFDELEKEEAMKKEAQR